MQGNETQELAVMAAKKIPAEPAPPVARDTSRDIGLEHIAAALQGLQFGVVLIIVQDGVIIQIERTEKTRLRGKKQNP